MTWSILAVMAILIAAVVLFVSEKLSIDLVALLVLGSLLVLGLVTPEEGVSGFSNPATVTVAAMFVLSSGLQRTGAAASLGRLLLRWGRSHFLAMLVVMLAAGVLSAFLNNTAAVAVFIPLVLTLAARRKISASKLLIPLSFASQFGGVCTLIGTSTNLLVSAISKEAGYGSFSMFEFTRMGLVLFVAGTLYFLLIGRWLLPERSARELAKEYHLDDFITELRVMAGSPLIDHTVKDSRLSEHDVTVLRLLHGEQRIWAPLRQPLQAGDVLLVRGRLPDLMALRESARLQLNADFRLRDTTLEPQDMRLLQVLVVPGSKLIGETLESIDFRSRFKGIVLAMRHHGRTINSQLHKSPLELGDLLLVQVPRAQLEYLRSDEALLILEDAPDASDRRHKAPIALVILSLVVGLAALDLVPILTGSLLGCLLLVLSRCLTTDEAYQAIDWKVIFLLAGLLPLGLAMAKTGAAPWLAGLAVAAVGDWGPIATLAALYLLTTILTEFMSNNASAVLIAPIAISTAEQLGVDPRPFLMAVALAASTSFCTPVGYQTNAMIYNPGGYRYLDFLKVGLPLNLLFWLLSVLLVPYFWSF